MEPVPVDPLLPVRKSLVCDQRLKMKTFILISLGALVFAACDSKQEQARKAELDARADKLDEAAKATEKNAKSNANVVKKEGEAKAEALKEEAKATRDEK
jgi:hypothetical protein